MNKKDDDGILMWEITIQFGHNATDEERDFVAELVSEEARNAMPENYFILQDILESKRYSKLLIEGTQQACENIKNVLRDNISGKINYKEF